MKRFPLPQLAVLLVAVLVFSCGKARVIPRGKFIDIYVDMFVADQWIRENPAVKRTTDTLKVYEGIFDRYGYTSEDYAKTVRHYMREPDKYVKVMKKVVKRLDAKEKEMKDLIAKIERLDKLHVRSAPVADSLLRRFSADSFYVGRPDVMVNRYFDIILGTFDRDTVYAGPEMIVASDSVVTDSLAVDTLATAVRDTLPKLERPTLKNLPEEKVLKKRKNDLEKNLREPLMMDPDNNGWK